MRNIYAKARQVLIWLGQGSETSEGAFRYLLEGPRFASGPAPTWETFGLNLMTEPHQTTSFTKDLKYLEDLLERDWFRRLWVLQEVAHGRKVLLIAGKQTISWDLFAQAVIKLYHSGRVRQDFSAKSQVGAAAVMEIESFRQSRQLDRVGAHRNQHSLLSVLLATHSGECSDTRDRIYAVLNLADDYDSTKDVDILWPDYSLHPRDTFVQFARWCVRRGHLDILSCTTRRRTATSEEWHVDSLPSWVPDWTRIDNDDPFVRYIDRLPFEADIGLSLMPQDPPMITEDNRLILYGTVVDTIKEVGSPSTFKKSSAHKGEESQLVDIALGNRAWLDECRHLSWSLHHEVRDSSRNPFWKTITAGLTGDGREVPVNFHRQFEDYVQLLEEIPCSAIHESTENTNSKQISNQFISKFYSNKQTVAMVESSILMWTSKRRFAITEEGAMALVPNTTRTGDVVVVVAGSNVPLIFRRVTPGVGKYHMVLGEAFIDDLMDGQVVKRHVEDYKRLGKGHKRLVFKQFAVI
ncbi:hypothetical protein ACHAPU_005700 [Fusarium lateritium]